PPGLRPRPPPLRALRRDSLEARGALRPLGAPAGAARCGLRRQPGMTARTARGIVPNMTRWLSTSACRIVLTVSLVMVAPAWPEAPAPAVVTLPENVRWLDAGGMPKGVQFSLVTGDPLVGPYLILLKIPAGTAIKPHFHNSEEATTILS